MDPGTRVFIAATAGRLITGDERTGILDHSRSKEIDIIGDVTDKRVLLFDNDRRCNFSGIGSDGSFHLFDSGNKVGISLTIEGEKFQGFDSTSQRNFNGSVKNHEVTMYDGIDPLPIKYSYSLTMGRLVRVIRTK